MRSASWWMGILAMVAACHRQPAPVLEYGETVTYTSTANDPAPQPIPAAHVTAGAPAPPPPAAPASLPAAVAPAPAESEAAPVTPSNDEWTTTVHTGDVRNVSSPSEPETAPAVSDTPQAPVAQPPAPRQWYKAKPW